jgi:hypothetical protein
MFPIDTEGIISVEDLRSGKEVLANGINDELITGVEVVGSYLEGFKICA